MFRSVFTALTVAAGLALSSGVASAAYISTVDLNTTYSATLTTEKIGGVGLTGPYQSFYDYEIIGTGGQTTFTLVDAVPDTLQVRYFVYEDSNDTEGEIGLGTKLLETVPYITDISNTSTSASPFFSLFLAAGEQFVLRINKNVDGGWDSISTQISAVPLPGAALLFGTALAGFFGFSNRRKV